MKTVFIGGSRNLYRLNSKLKERLLNVVNKNFNIIVGDANGVDKSIQQFLKNIEYQNVYVYCSGNKCRNNLAHWITKNINVDKKITGRDFYMIKDKAMSQKCDYGFMLWDGKSPGTINNILNLLDMHKITLLYFSPKQIFVTIKTIEGIEHIVDLCENNIREILNKKINYKSRILGVYKKEELELKFT